LDYYLQRGFFAWLENYVDLMENETKGDPMRIKIINPDFGMSPESLRYREKMLSNAALPDTHISMDCVTASEVEIDSALDVVIAGPEIVSRAIQAEKDGYDAVILYCLSDPAISACREAVKIPVIGGGQVSVLVAALLGYRFSILTTSPWRKPEKEEFIRTTGVDPTRLASIRSISVSLQDARKDTHETIRQLSDAAKACAEEDGAQVVVLGCLSFAGMSAEISHSSGVPVVDPAFALVSMAELLYAQKLSHSKIAYPYPPDRKRTWQGGSIAPRQDDQK
jgi:allantoin racemase